MLADACSLHAAHDAVAGYYTRKLRRHGPTPAGVDWASSTGQDLRFALLLRVCDFAAPFSLNDLGCGYGAMLDYLDARHPGAPVDYLGVDVSAAMAGCAARRWQGRPMAQFVRAATPPRVADYAIASGIFNVVPPGAEPCWDELVADTLAGLHATTRRGFAVNFIASRPAPADGPCLHPGLYSTLAAPWMAFCTQRLGAAATLVPVPILGEFTLLVRRRCQPLAA